MAALSCVLAASAAHADTCSRDDFAGVVDQAGSILRKMNADNAPVFQAKLRQLKQARHWSDKDLVEKARPLVEDDKIADYDAEAGQMLDEISALGSPDPGVAPDCGVLTHLRAHLDKLVETVKAKWAYMFGKVDAELKQP